MSKDYYKILNLPPTASQDDIRQSYKNLCLRYHPDKMNSEDKTGETFKIINEAYSILSDPQKKSMYDMAKNVESDVTIDIFYRLIQNLLKILKTKFEEKNKESTPTNKNLKLSIPITINDLYNGSLKKITLKVYRKQTNGILALENTTFYISLINYRHQEPIIYKNIGDEDLFGNRKDVEVLLDIVPNENIPVKVDDICNTYDLMCFDQPLSLYEYYGGLKRSFDYFNNEKIELIHEFTDISSTWIRVSGKGLMYKDHEDDDECKRGDLIIYFKLELPPKDTIPLDVIENILQVYYK